MKAKALIFILSIIFISASVSAEWSWSSSAPDFVTDNNDPSDYCPDASEENQEEYCERWSQIALNGNNGLDNILTLHRHATEDGELSNDETGMLLTLYTCYQDNGVESIGSCISQNSGIRMHPQNLVQLSQLRDISSSARDSPLEESEDSSSDSSSTEDSSDSSDSETEETSSGEPMYDGFPRSSYFYSGKSTDTFKQWRRGDIKTSTFQVTTSQGEGTSALSLASSTVYANYYKYQKDAGDNWKLYGMTMVEEKDDSMEEISVSEEPYTLSTGSDGFCGIVYMQREFDIQNNGKYIEINYDLDADAWAGKVAVWKDGSIAKEIDPSGEGVSREDSMWSIYMDEGTHNVRVGLKDTGQHCSNQDHSIDLQINSISEPFIDYM